MNNNISFTGIKNVYVGKKVYTKFGTYLDAASELKQGEKVCTDIKIACELVDDASGADFTFFKKQLEKCGDYYKNNCLDKENPNKITMYMQRQDVADDVVDVSNANFTFNKCSLYLNNQAVLPLYTCMAKITNKISSQPNISTGQKMYSDLFNKSVHEEAVKFIENGI